MTGTAVPYMLRPKATKLAPGPDDSLEPSEAPTDPATRTAPPFVWPRVNTAKGPAGPPEGPLAPPATDPAARSAPPFVWANSAVPNRPMAEQVSPLGALDPDIALWREVLLSIWPFTGAPTTGVWPAGWMGIDNTGQPWVCTVAGAPGTWEPVGFTSAGVASFDTRTGAVVLEPSDAGNLFTAQGQLLVGTGDGTAELLASGAANTILSADGAGDVTWQLPAYPNLTRATGTLGSTYTVTGSLATFLTTSSLGVGTYLVTFSGNVGLGGSAPQLSVLLTTGSASGVVLGPAGQTFAGTSIQGSLTFSAIVIVTVAGTLIFEADTSNGGTGALIQGGANQTGYTAVRLA